ncbi:MAG: hypothetical protein RIR90_349 [Bacteroidota bacterium]|jgi:hypothetical protein
MLLRSFNLTSCFRRSACCFQTFKDLFGFFAAPFLIGVAKVGAFFISTKIYLSFFSNYLASMFLRTVAFFQADGKDKAVIFTGKFYFKFFSLFSFSLTHRSKNLLLITVVFQKRAAKISVNTFLPNIF